MVGAAAPRLGLAGAETVAPRILARREALPSRAPARALRLPHAPIGSVPGAPSRGGPPITVTPDMRNEVETKGRAVDEAPVVLATHGLTKTLDGLVAVDVLPIHHIKTLRDLLTSDIASVSERGHAQSNYALMHGLLEFTAFVEAALPALLERWQQSRATAASSCAPFAPPDMRTSQSAGGTT